MTKHYQISIIIAALLAYNCDRNHDENVLFDSNSSRFDTITTNQQNYTIKEINLSEYQHNELLFDENDAYLMNLDTILNFSTSKFLYEVKIQKENIKITSQRWSEMPNGTGIREEIGIQKDGFIYIRDNSTLEYKIQYKIILNKCLFVWNEGLRQWQLIYVGDS